MKNLKEHLEIEVLKELTYTQINEIINGYKDKADTLDSMVSEIHELLDEETFEPKDTDNFTFDCADIACKYSGLH
jgi:hypothetical protein